MSRQFKVKAVLRYLDKSLLISYLKKHGVEVLPPKPESGDEIDKLAEWILGLQQVTALSEGLREVNEMATEDGLLALLQIAEMKGLHPQVEIEKLSGHHDQALFFYLNYPNVFEDASVLYHVTDLKAKVERYLRKRPGDFVSSKSETLAEALKSFLLLQDGRGRECVVNVYRYIDHVCFIAYPEDFAKAPLCYEENRLRKFPLRPTFEIVFLYYSESGKVELSAKGGPRRQRELFNLFNRVVLEDNSDIPALEKTYDLEKFLDKELKLSTLIEDQVEYVRLQKLRVFDKLGQYRMTLEPNDPTGIGSMRELIEKYEIRPLRFNVTQAEIKMKFPGKGRRGSVTIQLSYPDKCNLNDSPNHLKAKKYLEQWGLVNRTPVQKPSAGIGQEPSPAAV